MDTAVIINTAGVLAGTAVGSMTTVLVQRSASRNADRAQAGALLAQVKNAVGRLQAEITVMRLRRDSWRANSLALGQAILRTMAAHAEGNWLIGAAASTAELRKWDMTEAERFQAGSLAAIAEINPALVVLSLTDPIIQNAAADLAEQLKAYVEVKRLRDIDAVSSRVDMAAAELERAVRAYTARKWWRRK